MNFAKDIAGITRPIALILIGLPGSGKSTWTEKLKLVSEKQFAVISSDSELEIIMESKGISYSEAFRNHIGEATGRMKGRADTAINSKENLIWDQTNMSAKKRRGILQKLGKDYYKIAVDFSVDPKELERRLKERAEKTGKFIPNNVIIDMGKAYNAPTKSEGFDEVIRIKN